MIYVAEGEFKTSHYSLCTAFMALGLAIPGMFAGKMQQALGYSGFFLVVMACCLVTLAVTSLLKVDPDYGRKK